MRKVLFVLVLLFGVSFVSGAAHAGFLSDLFSKKSAVVAEPIKTIKPIDKIDLAKRIKITQQIAGGFYSGKKEVEISFSEKELQSLFLPWVNKMIKENPQFASSSVDNLFLADGAIEISGIISWSMKSAFMISVTPSVVDGKLKLDVNKAKVGWFNLPKSMINKLLVVLKIKPEDLVRPLPHFELESVIIKDGLINIAGKYKKY